MKTASIFLAVAGVSIIPAAAPGQETVDPRTISAHTRFLSSDRLRGRDTGSRGFEIAADYVESRCIALGLHPAAGRYRHRVPMIVSAIDGATVQIVTEPPVDHIPPGQAAIPNFMRAGLAASFSGHLVPVDPDAIPTAESGILDGAVALIGGVIRSSSVIDTLASRGAVGLVQMTGSEELYQAYVRSRGPKRFYLEDASIPSVFAGSIPTVIVNVELGESLLASLPARVRVSVTSRESRISPPNVACLLHGRGASGHALALSAHLDHLGVGEPDASGDSIYNGFSDNAAGVAMLLAIAETLTAGPLPENDILFLFFTGEERGLLGSQYMVHNPVWEPGSLLGLINLDAGAPPAPPARWEVVAGDDSQLGRAARIVAERRGWGFRSSAMRPNSDSYPFHLANIPSIFVIPGARPYEGLTAAQSDSLFQRWDAYHRPADEWSADFPFEGLVRYADYALQVLREYDRGAGSATR